MENAISSISCVASVLFGFDVQNAKEGISTIPILRKKFFDPIFILEPVLFDLVVFDGKIFKKKSKVLLLLGAD